MQVEVAKARGSSTDGDVYSGVVLQQLLQTSFARLALTRITPQDAQYRSSVHIQSPCMLLTIYGQCMLPAETCSAYHRAAERNDYRERCQILLNQIRIVDHHTKFAQRLGRSAKEIEEPRRFWLETLADCLCPPTAALGSAINVNLASLHGGPEGLAVVRRWLSESFNQLSAGSGEVSVFFRNVQRMTSFIAELFPTGTHSCSPALGEEDTGS